MQKKTYTLQQNAVTHQVTEKMRLDKNTMVHCQQTHNQTIHQDGRMTLVHFSYTSTLPNLTPLNSLLEKEKKENSIISGLLAVNTVMVRQRQSR